MQLTDDDEWVLDIESAVPGTEFKLTVVDSMGNVVWEPCENRVLTTSDGCLRLVFGDRAMTPVQDDVSSGRNDINSATRGGLSAPGDGDGDDGASQVSCTALTAAT